MRVVLPAVLRVYEVRAAEGSPELARRRNITIIPSAGARMRLRARAASADPARGVPAAAAG